MGRFGGPARQGLSASVRLATGRVQIAFLGPLREDRLVRLTPTRRDSLSLAELAPLQFPWQVLVCPTLESGSEDLSQWALEIGRTLITPFAPLGYAEDARGELAGDYLTLWERRLEPGAVALDFDEPVFMIGGR